MDIFELAYKLVAQGQTEAAAGLQAVDAAGTKATASLTQVEAAAKRASEAGARVAQAFRQAGLQLDESAFQKGIAQGITEGFREVEAAGTASAAGLGTFNQRVVDVGTHAATSSRGIYLLDRGLGAIIGSSVGASSGIERLAEGLLLFSTGGHTATVVLAGIAAVLIPLTVAYEALTAAQRKVQEQFDAAYSTFANQKAGADALATAYLGLAEALDQAAKARERLAAVRPPDLAQVLPPDVAAFIGGEQRFPILGPGLGGLTGLIAARYEDAKASEAQGAATRAVNAVQLEQIAAYEKEAATLREQIAQGIDVSANRQRLAETERNLTAAVATHTTAVQQQNIGIFGQLATLPELIAARRREIATLSEQAQQEAATGRVRDETKKKLGEATEALAVLEKAYQTAGIAVRTITTDTKALADAERAAAQPGIELAGTLASLVQLGIASAADRRLAITLEQAYATAARNTSLAVAERRALAAAAKGIQDALTGSDRDAITTLVELQKLHLLDAAGTAALEAAYRRLTLAVQQHVGSRKQQLENARELKLVEDALALPMKEQAEALAKQADLAAKSVQVFGPSEPRVQALRIAVANLAEATTDDNIARLLNLGLIQQAIALLEAQKKAVEALAVSTRASIPTRTPGFGLGGVTVPEAQAHPFGALVPGQPTRDLTAPFGAGLVPQFPDSAFSGAREAFVRGTNSIVKAGEVAMRAGRSEMQGIAVDFARTFENALKNAFTDVAASIGALLGGLFSGQHIDFGKEILAALGNLFVRMGEAMIAASPIFKGLAAAMSNPFTAGPALAAYGAALVALGAALGAIAQGGSGAGAPGGGGAGGASQPIHVIVVDSATRAAIAVQQPAPFIYAPTNIGVTDPVGQRQMSRMMQLAGRRNLPSGI